MPKTITSALNELAVDEARFRKALERIAKLEGRAAVIAQQALKGNR